VLSLHVLQPVVRSFHRYLYRLSAKRLPAPPPDDARSAPPLKRISGATRDVYWASRRGRGRENLLADLEATAGEWGWRGAFHEEWQSWDVLLQGDRWHNLILHTATEELGGAKRFTRARCSLRPTHFAVVASSAAAVGLAVGAAGGVRTAAVAGAIVVLLVALQLASRRRCFAAVAALLGAAGRRADLDLFHPKGFAVGRWATWPQNRRARGTAVNATREAALATMLTDGDARELTT
jgi:hypothetical protein